MTPRNTKQNLLCDDCQNFVGKSRDTKPHAGLVYTGGKSAANATYYTCRNCQHEWLYETGSGGMGWVV